MDIGFPLPARFDFVLLGDFITVLGFDIAIEAKVGLLVQEGGTVWVPGDVPVGVFEGGTRGSGGQLGGGREGTG